MNQDDTSSESGTVQRQFVTRPLGDRQRVGRLAQGGRIGQPISVQPSCDTPPAS
ncbi:MAG TPA: hypothetical protein VN888_24965 [Mycobacterium sp.]|nr:hypothetical protein [Mycobacterium sp.]